MIDRYYIYKINLTNTNKRMQETSRREAKLRIWHCVLVSGISSISTFNQGLRLIYKINVGPSRWSSKNIDLFAKIFS